PLVLAKLWSVLPKLFVWPPVRSIMHLLERLTLIMLVGGIVFELATGVLNIQYDYVFGFSFYTAHYFVAWAFIAGFIAHIIIKVPTEIASLRTRRASARVSQADPGADHHNQDELTAADPQEPTISCRGALALVGGGSVL